MVPQEQLEEMVRAMLSGQGITGFAISKNPQTYSLYVRMVKEDADKFTERTGKKLSDVASALSHSDLTVTLKLCASGRRDPKHYRLYFPMAQMERKIEAQQQNKAAAEATRVAAEARRAAARESAELEAEAEALLRTQAAEVAEAREMAREFKLLDLTDYVPPAAQSKQTQNFEVENFLRDILNKTKYANMFSLGWSTRRSGENIVTISFDDNAIGNKASVNALYDFIVSEAQLKPGQRHATVTYQSRNALSRISFTKQECELAMASMPEVTAYAGAGLVPGASAAVLTQYETQRAQQPNMAPSPESGASNRLDQGARLGARGSRLG